MTESANSRHDLDCRCATCAPPPSTPPKTFGRYVLHAPIARGGMARVYTARLVGAEGFTRLVAAKRLHPQFTDDPDFVAMFHDEARIASRIHHPNVVPVLDVVVEGQEVILVQEYVHGVPLDRLFRASLSQESAPIPVGIVVAIIGGVLSGLHAAHETKDELEHPLDIVHRDVSPQNVMVSVDGIPRLLDFGIARAQSNAHVTREGLFKGKVAYMAPEQLRADALTRAADIFGTGVMLWELLTHKRLHAERSDAQVFTAVINGELPTVTQALAERRMTLPRDRWEKLLAFDPIVRRALDADARARFATAQDMLDAILRVCPAATPSEVAQWVKSVGAEFLDQRQKVLASTEESWRSLSQIPAASSSRIIRAEKSEVSRALQLSAAHAFGEEVSVASIGRPGNFFPGAPPTIWPVPFAPSSLAPAQEPRRARVPWIIAAALLALSGVLVGILTASPSAPQAAAARLPERAAADLLGAPPPLTEQPANAPGAPPARRPGVVDPVSPSAPASESVVAVAPKPVAPPPPQAAAPTPHPNRGASPRAPVQTFPHSAASAPAATPPSTATASAPPPRQDCDPPFYFDGTKKLYKPGCL